MFQKTKGLLVIIGLLAWCLAGYSTSNMSDTKNAPKAANTPVTLHFYKVGGKNGVYTHLVSDHYHYWEAGGSTYHTSYNTWDFERGQEGGPWIGQVKELDIPEHVGDYDGQRLKLFKQDWINREAMDTEDKHSQARTFAKGLDFIERNGSQDRWFLQIEVFDPHEPFFTHQKYKDLYPHEYSGPHFDWPGYRGVQETEEQIDHCRREYAALVSMCEHLLG
jgi:arylsulfatase A-like enzyme